MNKLKLKTVTYLQAAERKKRKGVLQFINTSYQDLIDKRQENICLKTTLSSKMKFLCFSKEIFETRATY